jgi:hypothetical protein
MALEEAKSALNKAKDDMARYYNQRRLPTPTYQPGDKVYLDASDISTTRPSRKLSHHRLGPYPIERQVSKNAYCLQLPNPMRRLHPVFNVVKLTPAPADPIEGRQPKLPPPPELVDGEEEYLVEEILNSKMFRGRLRFLIKWEDYGVEHNLGIRLRCPRAKMSSRVLPKAPGGTMPNSSRNLLFHPFPVSTRLL